MRDLIVARLEEMKEKSGGFSRIATMRWANLFVTVNGKPKHISEVEWCELDDDALLSVYERVIRRFFTQM
jgi:hypothetical protein